MGRRSLILPFRRMAASSRPALRNGAEAGIRCAPNSRICFTGQADGVSFIAVLSAAGAIPARTAPRSSLIGFQCRAIAGRTSLSISRGSPGTDWEVRAETRSPVNKTRAETGGGRSSGRRPAAGGVMVIGCLFGEVGGAEGILGWRIAGGFLGWSDRRGRPARRRVGEVGRKCSGQYLGEKRPAFQTGACMAPRERWFRLGLGRGGIFRGSQTIRSSVSRKKGRSL